MPPADKPTTPPKPASEKDEKEAVVTAPKDGEPTVASFTDSDTTSDSGSGSSSEKDTGSDASLTAVAPALDAPTLDDADTYGDPTNKKTERVYREGDVDFNSVSDTSYTAQGSRYPLTPERAESLAASLEAEADLAEHEANMKREAAETARQAANDIRSRVDQDS